MEEHVLIWMIRNGIAYWNESINEFQLNMYINNYYEVQATSLKIPTEASKLDYIGEYANNYLSEKKSEFKICEIAVYPPTESFDELVDYICNTFPSGKSSILHNVTEKMRVYIFVTNRNGLFNYQINQLADKLMDASDDKLYETYYNYALAGLWFHPDEAHTTKYAESDKPYADDEQEIKYITCQNKVKNSIKVKKKPEIKVNVDFLKKLFQNKNVEISFSDGTLSFTFQLDSYFECRVAYVFFMLLKIVEGAKSVITETEMISSIADVRKCAYSYSPLPLEGVSI